MNYSEKPFANIYIKITLSLVVVLLLSGCAYFSKTKTANLSHFSKHTVTMIGTLNYDLTDTELLYLRDSKTYIDEPDPFKRYIAIDDKVSFMLKSIAAYSLLVVSISEQDLTLEKKKQALAGMLYKLRDNMVEGDSINTISPDSKEYLTAIINKTLSSTSYVTALQNAQRLINSYNVYIGIMLDELIAEQKLIASKIVDSIDKKYGVSVEFEKELRHVRQKYYKALILVSRYVETQDATNIAEIRDLDIERISEILKGKKLPSRSDMRKIHKVSSETLTLLNTNYNQVLPDIKLYHQSHLELNRILSNKLNSIKQARLTVIVWSRAHGKMAAGKTKPAEWFDVTDTGGLLFDAAQRSFGL